MLRLYGLMKKMVGYIILAIGFALLALSYAEIRTALNLTILEEIGDIGLIAAGIILVVVGAFVAFKLNASRKVREVPIYHGKDLVGYRRIQQK